MALLGLQPGAPAEAVGGDEIVENLCDGAGAVARHGTNVRAKRIDVDVEWGPSSDRKCLNGLRGAGIANYSRPVSVFKCAIERGTLE